VVREAKCEESSATLTGPPPGEMAAQIARVAARLFAERGYDTTSVREIVEAARVTKPTLYYYFGSKQGLAEALLTRPMTAFVATLAGLVEREADPAGLLRETIAAHLAFITEEPDRARFFYGLCFGPQGTSLRDEIHRFGQAIDGKTADVARKLADAGVIDLRRVDACAQVIRGVIMSASLDQIFCGHDPEPGLADRLASDILGGFGRPGFLPDGDRGQGS